MNTLKNVRTWLVLGALVTPPICLPCYGEHDGNEGLMREMVVSESAGFVNRAPAVLPEDSDGLSPAQNLGTGTN